MFKLLAVLLAIYTLGCVLAGRVHAKAGPGLRTVLRQESPGYFWTVIGIYAALCVALATVF